MEISASRKESATEREPYCKEPLHTHSENLGARGNRIEPLSFGALAHLPSPPLKQGHGLQRERRPLEPRVAGGPVFALTLMVSNYQK